MQISALSPSKSAQAAKPAKGKRQAAAGRAPHLRSVVTNGTSLFIAGDQQSPWARRFRDLCDLHADDLGSPAILSEAQLSLIRRAATLECQLEAAEGRMSVGEGCEPADLDLYSRMTGQLTRVLNVLGLKRVPRDVTHNPLVDHFSRPPIREGA